MTPIEVILNKQLLEAERKRTISVLVDVLMLGLRITEGAELVLLLGDGAAKNNREAVYQWVEAQLQQLESTSLIKTKGILASRLYKRLIDAEGSLLIH